ncbi:hypothetical protein [Vibrio anguillarum]|uniref:hypothetical protein n=1 Tax=Vibrio anguillarum TaxID=55601 RepID=UPI0030EF43A5
MIDQLISSPPESRRFWVVRADGGKYFQHFSKFGVVALGHLDKLNLPESKVDFFKPEYDKLKESLSNLHTKNDKSSRHSTNHFNQAKHFVADMSVGDWVVTVGNNAIRVGRVISPAYVSRKPLDIIYNVQKDLKLTMDMTLRRDVSWGPRVPKSELPYGVVRSLMANQTLFCIDEHWEALYHMLFPVFRKDDDIYFTVKIKQKENIRNVYVSKILDSLNDLEALTQANLNDVTVDSYQKYFLSLVENDELLLTTKAQFHSPGDILAKLHVGKKMASAYFIYSLMFGNAHLGVDGLIDLETRHKLIDLVIKRAEANSLDSVKEKLAIQPPNYDTSALDSDEKDVKDIQQVKN